MSSRSVQRRHEWRVGQHSSLACERPGRPPKPRGCSGFGGMSESMHSQGRRLLPRKASGRRALHGSPLSAYTAAAQRKKSKKNFQADLLDTGADRRVLALTRSRKRSTDSNPSSCQLVYKILALLRRVARPSARLALWLFAHCSRPYTRLEPTSACYTPHVYIHIWRLAAFTAAPFASFATRHSFTAAPSCNFQRFSGSSRLERGKGESLGERVARRLP